ncbi:hypothetical protein PANT111_40229 [Pantoea brenneri]|uniref:Uncharacterized protein n=1 Tax=Pantoea brenneri TaxID=472694 RepID=A0AAX3JAS0_9GAMM|nr:hypothetical protein PANT111_40229 [Pantoea brenneri]
MGYESNRLIYESKRFYYESNRYTYESDRPKCSFLFTYHQVTEAVIFIDLYLISI